MKITNAKVFNTNFEFENKDIYIDGSLFADKSSSSDELDAKGLYAIPSLIDIHFHGSVGYDFMDGTKEALDNISKYQASIGVGAMCPATMTMSEEDILKACENGKNFVPHDDCADLVGINMEGPFVSHQKIGAQNPAFVQKPTAELFRKAQKAAGGLIKLMAIAPESEGGLETISELKDEVLSSIAHTTANYDLASRAIAAGATHITHLYNAMPPLAHRDPGPIGAGADAPWCEAEIICDNIHIHPSAVRAAFRMYGPERMILISDSMMAVGLENGDYELGGQKVIVKDRKATLESGTIAGSATNLFDCMKIAHKVMKLPLSTVVRAASYNPARSIGVLDKYGTIESGKVANVLLVDEDLNLKAVILRGKILFNKI